MTAAEHLQAAIHWTIHPSYPSLFGGQLRTCEEMGQIGVQQPNSASFSPKKSHLWTHTWWSQKLHIPIFYLGLLLKRFTNGQYSGLRTLRTPRFKNPFPHCCVWVRADLSTTQSHSCAPVASQQGWTSRLHTWVIFKNLGFLRFQQRCLENHFPESRLPNFGGISEYIFNTWMKSSVSVHFKDIWSYLHFLRLSQATPSLHSCHCDARNSDRSAECSPPLVALRWRQTAARNPDMATDPDSRSLQSRAQGRTTRFDLHRDPGGDQFLRPNEGCVRGTNDVLLHVAYILIYIYIYIRVCVYYISYIIYHISYIIYYILYVIYYLLYILY